MSADPTTTAALGLEPTYSAQEAAAMLGRSYSWLDQRLRAGQFVLPDGTTVQPVRTPGGYRRFTLQMLRNIFAASAYHGWFSVEDTRCALFGSRAVRFSNAVTTVSQSPSTAAESALLDQALMSRCRRASLSLPSTRLSPG